MKTMESVTNVGHLDDVINMDISDNVIYFTMFVFHQHICSLGTCC